MPVILPVSSPRPVSGPVHFWLGKLWIGPCSPLSLSVTSHPSSKLPANPLKGALIFFCCCPKAACLQHQLSAGRGNMPQVFVATLPVPFPFSLLPQLAPAVLTPHLSFSLSSPAEYNERICIWRNLAWYAWQSQLPAPPSSSPPHTHTTLVCFQAQEFSFIHFHISHSLALLPFALKCDFSLDFLIMRQWWSRHSQPGRQAVRPTTATTTRRGINKIHLLEPYTVPASRDRRLLSKRASCPAAKQKS